MERHLRRELPLVVPMTLLQHHITSCRVEYLARRTRLEPSPPELMLRNHA